MMVLTDLERFIYGFDDGLRASRRPLALIPFAIICCFAVISAGAAGLDDLKGETVVHTDDGQIIAGWVKSSSEGQLKLDTKFGDLMIDWGDVLRVNGEQYDQEAGIVRKHNIELRADGSAKVEALVPVALRTDDKKTSFLAVGRILQVLDLDGRPLSYSSSMLGDFSRCQVNALPYRVPAMQVTTVVPDAAEIEDGLLRYQFDYTPRMDQAFQLEIGIPIGSEIQAATPVPNKVTETELQWSLDALAQRAIEFEVDLKLPN
ncbi:hypothetical protein K8I31_14860 [bacterium]|nr:hypothetical protein [bacterium]